MQSICEEATYLTIAHDYENGADLINKIDAIVEKYRPTFIPKTSICSEYGGGSTQYPQIRWYFDVYSHFDNMLNTAPYGGACVYYPSNENNTNGKIHAGPAINTSTSQFIPADGKECPPNPENHSDAKKYMTGNGLPNNCVFVLTFSCNYPFSNAMTKALFNGGSNTKRATFYQKNPRPTTGAKGTIYLLWARGAGIVNPK